MKPDPLDDLDRQIDETLASLVSGEPRRVTGASVLRAMDGARRGPNPLWFAIAAVLVVGVAIGIRRGRPEPVPVAALPEVRVDAPDRGASSMPEPTVTPIKDPVGLLASNRPARSAATEPVFEGLPRITIALIEPPAPIATSRLESEAIRIDRLEITPLSVSALSKPNEQ